MALTTLLLAAALVYGVLSDTDCPIPENSIYEPSSFQKCIYNSKNGKATYDSSELFCRSANGHLLKISNAYENSLAVSFLYEENGASGQNVRLGLRRTNGIWRWSDGSDATYLRFGAGNPRSGVDCVTLSTADLLWYSTDCQVQSPFSCLFPTLNNTKPSPEIGGKCRPGWNYFAETNMCYFVGRNASYYAAENVCALLGTSLASVHSLRESNFIAGLTLSIASSCTINAVYSSYRTWIGGYYSDQWRWTDGTNFDYNNLDGASNQKSGSLALVSDSYCSNFGRWTNYSPSSQFAYFVCKTPAS